MYSQGQEEKVILDYFGSSIGTFISIGENDGITFSNVRALAELGWAGYCIEASPKAYKKLEKNYKDFKKIIEFNCAIAPITGKITLHESGALLGDSDVALVSTIVPAEMDRFKASVVYEQVEVDAYTWNDFIGAYGILQKFDFISIDIEGSEMNVLPNIDLTHTKMICIENNGSDNLRYQYEQYLEGFKLIHVNGENLIYAR